MTEWKPVVGWESGYLVSNEGVVKTIGGRILKQWPNSAGYPLVRLNKPRELCRVHRLVAAAFLPNPDNLPVVNHIDHSRTNNNVNNLEWCTQSYNLEAARVAGRMPVDYWRGKRSPNAMLADAQVRLARNLYDGGGWSWEALAREFEVSKRCMGRLLKRETYNDI